MKIKVISLLIAALLLTTLASCEKEPDNNDGKIFANELLEQNQEPVYGTIEPGTEDQYTDIWLEYTDEKRLYFKLLNNVADTMPIIAKAISDKGWDNIVCEEGFPDKYFNWGVYMTEEEENAPLTCVVQGNMDYMNIIIPVIFTSEYPYGKVTRVIYAGSRHCVESEEMEILDPFRRETWAQDFSY